MLNMIIEIQAYLGNINGRIQVGRCLIAPAAIVAILQTEVTVIEEGKSTPSKRPASLLYLAGVNEPITTVLPLEELARFIEDMVRQTSVRARANSPSILVPTPGR